MFTFILNFLFTVFHLQTYTKLNLFLSLIIQIKSILIWKGWCTKKYKWVYAVFLKKIISNWLINPFVPSVAVW